MFDARFLAALQQVARGAGVVAVVLERIGDRFRHDGVGGEVHHCLDAMLAQHAADQLAIARVAHHQLTVQHRGAKAGGQIVQHHHFFLALAELPNHVTADVAGAAGDEDGHRV